MRKRLVTVIVLCGAGVGATAFAWASQRVPRGVTRSEYVAGVGQLSVYNIRFDPHARIGRLDVPTLRPRRVAPGAFISERSALSAPGLVRDVIAGVYLSAACHWACSGARGIRRGEGQPSE